MLQIYLAKGKNPTNKSVIYYPRLVSPKEITLDQMTEYMDSISTLDKGTIKACNAALVKYITETLQQGNRVKFPDFGTFRISLKNKLQTTEALANKNISSVKAKIVFIPEMTFRKWLKDSVKYQTVTEQVAKTLSGGKLTPVTP